MPAQVITEGLRTAEFLLHEANGYRSRDEIVLLPGPRMQPGTVLGAVLVSTAAGAAVAGNTGNGTISAVVVGGDAMPGIYQAKITKAPGDFEVIDPQGDVAGLGAVGVAGVVGGLGFTLSAGGTAFAVGDTFRITVTPGVRKYKAWSPTANDNSAKPCGFLYAAGGDPLVEKRAVGINRSAEVNGLMVPWPAGLTDAQKQAACADLASGSNLFVRF